MKRCTWIWVIKLRQTYLKKSNDIVQVMSTSTKLTCLCCQFPSGLIMYLKK